MSNRIIIVLILIVLTSGCAKDIKLHDNFKTIQETAKHDTKRFPLMWYDTKKTCGFKLLQADAETIILHNKLVTVRGQLNNLDEALDKRGRFKKFLDSVFE